MTGTPQEPSNSVLQMVSTATSTEPLDLAPLYDTLDPDALDGVIDGMRAGKVQFRYAGTLVTVHDDGAVEVTDESENDVEKTAIPPDE